MKVTVNFGAVRVIVPCGDGDLPVRQLMELASTRYKKATGKDTDIIVHNLKVFSDGGILDPDDKLNDVVDDKEQIIATFQESEFPYLTHNGGDGTSASSVGTESPDIFQNGELMPTNMKKPFYNGSDVEITAIDASSGILPLHVRRGSEPTLNQLSLLCTSNSAKRWSAAIMVDGECLKNFNSEGETSENESPPGEREDGSGEEKSSPVQDKRREPLGGPVTSPKLSRNIPSESESLEENFEVMKLKNEGGPLGIHVVPASNSPRKDYGLVIQGIDPGGRIDRDGRFSVGDKITEINGMILSKESFKNTQEIFKDALKASEISILCVKNRFSHLQDMPAKKKSPHTHVYSNPVSTMQKRETDSSDGLTEDEKGFMVSRPKFSTSSKRALVFNKSPSSAHSSLRKVGRRVLIHLKKGQAGLGFSISSKDSLSANHPLFVKSILPAGAAVDDGRLKVGDKILEINRTDVTGMTQDEVVNMLRRIPFGESVELVISRPEIECSPSPHLPRELPPEEAGDGVGVFPWNKRDVFTFDIPLNDTGSAGLGVSVKGKTSTTPNGAIDMGIFVKSVIHGGAASKDGRLKPNDQLLNINGISLLTMTNSQAMETLRRAMIQGEGPNANPNAITLTIARRIPSPLPNGDMNDNGDSSCHERSDSLLSESGDSFHVSNENLLSSPLSNKSKGITPDTSVSDNSGNTVICLSKSNNKDGDESMNVTYSTAEGDKGEVSMVDSLILEHLSWQKDRRSDASSQLSTHKRNKDKNQPTLTLIDVDPSEHYVFEAQQKSHTSDGSSSMRNSHKKSFSGSGEMLCQSQISSVSHRDAMQRSSHTQKSKFSRNGFGRQSMPEKEFYHGKDETAHNGFDVTPKSHYFYQTTEQKNAAKRLAEISRLENLDPCNTYVKVLPCKLTKPKAPRGSAMRDENSICTWSNSADSIISLRERPCSQQRVCHSPDCPYHAVPTTDRESESSQATTSTAPVGPSLGMYKSSSLESLQTLVHEMKKRDSSVNKDSTRACNESFRAAVDRSYEAAPTSDTMDILHETQESGLIHRPTASRSRIRSATVGPTADALADKKAVKPLKKKGLLKGLGSVFRFGKSNKKNGSDGFNKRDGKQKEQGLLEAKKAAEEERERIQQHYLRLVHQQQQKTPKPECKSSHQQLSNGHVHCSQGQKCPTASQSNPTFSPQVHSRQERMHKLRAAHQRQHQQRQGYYPRDEQEEIYEKQISEVVEKKKIWQRPLPPLPHQSPHAASAADDDNDDKGKKLIEFDPLSPEAKNYEIYKEMSKPGSRKGFVDPDRYSHYMNFQEIQQHLEQLQQGQIFLEDSKLSEIMLKFQQEVQDQQRSSKLLKNYRHTINAARMRPVSDLFDYESLQTGQSASKSRTKVGARSLPRQSFTSSRHRMPIPEYMREANGSINRNHVKYQSASNQHMNGNFYGRCDTTNF